MRSRQRSRHTSRCSSNVDVSHERSDQYYIYRLFDFREDPKLFLVPGDITSSFALEATQFVARPQ